MGNPILKGKRLTNYKGEVENEREIRGRLKGKLGRLEKKLLLDDKEKL